VKAGENREQKLMLEQKTLPGALG